MNTKKVYVELMDFIRANKNKKVSSILDHLEELTESKKSMKVSYTNEDGVVIAIKCYYFKTWMLVSEVEFGSKKHSNTGYNTMCKTGVSLWTKQQRKSKESKAQLLAQVSTGEVQPDELLGLMKDIETTRDLIDYDQSPPSFPTLEECLDSMK